jgi:glycosyltransferase involved in cell wall biosynthesis
MWPTVAVVVVTYQRRDVLVGTITRLREHLAYSGVLRFIVADDGSTDGTHELLEQMDIEPVVTQRGGLGANTNAGLRAAWEMTDYVFSTQDDMWLNCTLDLDRHVQKLQQDVSAGFVRLWGVAGHNYVARLDQQYWRVRWDSPELYIPSDRPHLKHKRFWDAYGPYPEGRATGDTEEAFCHQCRAIWMQQGGPDVLIPHAEDVERNFSHMCEGSRWRDQGL